jgi:hypothetical protein
MPGLHACMHMFHGVSERAYHLRGDERRERVSPSAQTQSIAQGEERSWEGKGTDLILLLSLSPASLHSHLHPSPHAEGIAHGDKPQGGEGEHDTLDHGGSWDGSGWVGGGGGEEGSGRVG